MYCTCKFEKHKQSSFVKIINKLSTIKSINDLMQVESISHLSVVKNTIELSIIKHKYLKRMKSLTLQRGGI
jgi:hypothetical protein